MQANDTVLNLNQLKDEEGKHLPDMVSFNNIAEAQAEISFKAGQEEEVKGGTNSIAYLEGLERGIKLGRQEVVDWVETNKRTDKYGNSIVILAYNIASRDKPRILSTDLWQAKLKDWE